MNYKFPVIYAVSNTTEINKPLYEDLLKQVSPERKERASRFLRFEDSCRSVTAEALLKYALKTSCNIDLYSVRRTENQWKKPIIENHDIHFNLTHSGDWVMCIIDMKESGIDVEKVKKVDFGIVPRFFSEHEQDFFAKCTNDADRLTTFSTLWVLKESYIKAIGRGLYCPLSSFSVLPDNNRQITLELHDESLPRKFFRLYDVGQNYRCAACCTDNIFPENIIYVKPEELLLRV